MTVAQAEFLDPLLVKFLRGVALGKRLYPELG